MKTEKTQVAIIGGGPAGMLLSHILAQNGVASVVLERQSKAYVLSRIRAGLLESGSVDMLRDYGLGARMKAEGHAKDGSYIVWQNKPDFFVDTLRWTGKKMMAYGQSAITEDLYAARARDGGQVICDAKNIALFDLDSDAPYVTYEKDGTTRRLICSYIAGCDGSHGVSRHAIPAKFQKAYERGYPFGWLGIMANVPPLDDLAYAYHDSGFALASQRSPTLSRYYLQCDIKDTTADWPDDRFWQVLLSRFPPDRAAKIVTGPSIEKSIAPLRSFVFEPMRYGRLFLAGDAAHIVPPTGAKGLNLAFSDIYYLSRGLTEQILRNNGRYLETYSDTALKRVWSAENFSWSLTKLLHVFPGEDGFDRKIRQNNYDNLLTQEALQENIARNYVGLPFAD